MRPIGHAISRTSVPSAWWRFSPGSKQAPAIASAGILHPAPGPIAPTHCVKPMKVSRLETSRIKCKKKNLDTLSADGGNGVLKFRSPEEECIVHMHDGDISKVIFTAKGKPSVE